MLNVKEVMEMKTVKEISYLTGVTVRSLQYYDKIDLLKPASYTDVGYRLYDDACLEKLQQILLFKELEFSLADIKEIINHPEFDKCKALEQQMLLLKLKRERLDKMIDLIEHIKSIGVDSMSFVVFDKKKIEQYSMEARKMWENTKEYKEFEEKNKDRSAEDERLMNIEIMEIFKEFGNVKNENPASEKVQELVMKLQTYITNNFFECTNEILLALGKTYVSGNEFTENIDKAGGSGAADFVYEAIKTYCQK